MVEAAYMWARHRWMVPYAAAAFLVVAGLAEFVGWDTWSARLGLGAAAAGVAVLATSDYRVLAQTAGGLVLLRASRIRQTATGLLDRLSPGVTIEQVGGTILAADWKVGDRRYSVPRSSEEPMRRIAAAGH